MATPLKCKLCGRSYWRKCDHGLKGEKEAKPTKVTKMAPSLVQIQDEKERVFNEAVLPSPTGNENTPRKRGRPRLGEAPLTVAQRQARYRERVKQRKEVLESAR